jgi:prephenate dehydrogenase
MITDDGFFPARIAIIGLGLMGGSLALALRGHCKKLLAVDNNSATIDLARRNGIVDQISDQLDEILPQADVIILAVPIKSIIQIIGQLATYKKNQAIIFDLGSTKESICEAMEKLPGYLTPIGGHPMCGRETNGLEHASADIFREATFALVACSNTTQPAKLMAESIVHHIKARPLWIDAKTHDEWTAATSHLPYLLSTALIQATPEAAASLIGPGFESTTRLASSSAQVMEDILTTNKTNVLDSLQKFRETLNILTRNLEDESGQLKENLIGTADKRTALLATKQQL